MERGRGVLEVSDKMPSWGEFYQSLENPPWKGFVWKRPSRDDRTLGPLEPLCLAGERGLGLVMAGTGLHLKSHRGEKSKRGFGLVNVMGTLQLPPVTLLCRVCKAPLLVAQWQSPTAANRYVAAHNIHKLGFPKNIFWGTFIILLLYCYQRDKILQVRPTERKENFDRAQNILTFSWRWLCLRPPDRPLHLPPHRSQLPPVAQCQWPPWPRHFTKVTTKFAEQCLSPNMLFSQLDKKHKL